MKIDFNIKKYLDDLAYIRMKMIINRRPLDINIETVSQCPLKCAFCCNRVYKRENIIMDNELFENIVDQYCKMAGGGIGLSSMQSDFFSDPLLLDRIGIIKRYKSKYKNKLWVYTTTPLLSLKKYNDMQLKYILSVFDYFQISVEGHDKESYRKMAGIDGFDIVYEQLRRIKKCIEYNSMSIRIDVYFRTYDKKELIRSEIYNEMKQTFNIDHTRDTFFSWFGTIKQEDLPDGATVVHRYNEKVKVNCTNPNASMGVMADGRVVGCGCIDWLEKYVIGDCRKNTLKEIWRSPKAVKFREAFERGRGLPSICRECALYASMNCMKDMKYLRYQPKDGLYYL